jgi:hypothetical protein
MFVHLVENVCELEDHTVIRLSNGRIPSAAQVAANSSLVYKAASSNETAVAEAELRAHWGYSV